MFWFLRLCGFLTVDLLCIQAAAGTGLLPLPRSVLARVLVSGGVGGCFGLFLCGTFLPPSPVLYAPCPLRDTPFVVLGRVFATYA